MFLHTVATASYLSLHTDPVLIALCSIGVMAWEPPEDFDYEPAYEIKANCGGGCEIHLGLEWLLNYEDSNNPNE